MNHMKRTIAVFALLLCCSNDPPDGASTGMGGLGGASSSAGMGGTLVTSSTAGSGAAASSAGGMGGLGGVGGMGGRLVVEDDAGADCGSPNGGIGPCIDPAQDCPPETECWSWICEFGHCVYVPKS